MVNKDVVYFNEKCHTSKKLLDIQIAQAEMEGGFEAGD